MLLYSVFVCIFVMSASPVVMFLLPSVVNVPAAATNPLALFPLKLNAYGPVSSVRFCTGFTTSVYVFVITAGGAPMSVTLMPNVNVACEGGFALASTPSVVNVKPVGKLDPVATLNVYGGAPPVAANCSLYATPTVAGGSGEVVVNAKLLTTI